MTLRPVHLATLGLVTLGSALTAGSARAQQPMNLPCTGRVWIESFTYPDANATGIVKYVITVYNASGQTAGFKLSLTGLRPGGVARDPSSPSLASRERRAYEVGSGSMAAIAGMLYGSDQSPGGSGPAITISNCVFRFR